MRIGCDLDNTIIDYKDLFYEASIKENLISLNHSREKFTIKKTIHSKNKDKWKLIQEIVYYQNISRAKIMRNFKKFYLEIAKRKIEFYIISHKTKKINNKNLRIVAYDWLLKKKFLKNIVSSNQNLFFESTNRKKIERINSLNLDYFIDDLESVLIDKKLNKNINKIQFNKKNIKNLNIPKLNWDGIFEFFF